MTSSPGFQRKKRGQGKWIVLLAVLVLISVAVVLIGQPIWKAKRTEQALNDRFGDAVTFVPAPDGSIPPDRVEAFLRVREQVYEHCSEFQERVGDLYHLESREQDEDVPKTTEAREGISSLKKLFSFGPAFLRLMETRNHALLEQDMGLGEYLYIYILAYADQLRQIDDTRFTGIEQAYVGSRARKELKQILRNQLDALMSGDVQPANMDLTAGLRDQIAGLSDGQHDFPWEEGLPPAIAASLKPYAESLAQLYCEGIAKIELMQKNKGLNVKN